METKEIQDTAAKQAYRRLLHRLEPQSPQLGPTTFQFLEILRVTIVGLEEELADMWAKYGKYEEDPDGSTHASSGT